MLSDTLGLFPPQSIDTFENYERRAIKRAPKSPFIFESCDYSTVTDFAKLRG